MVWACERRVRVMDVYCKFCREPWDNDTIHEEAAEREQQREPRTTYAEVAADFRQYGCGAFYTFTGQPKLAKCPNVGTDTRAVPEIDALGDLLGDDMDGLTAMLEDAGLV